MSNSGIPVVKDIARAGGNAIEGTLKVVENVVKNPLPVVTMVAATWALGPSGLALTSSTATAAALASGAIAASQGKNIGDIAKSALLAYGGAEFAKFTGAGDFTASIGNSIGGTTGSAVASGLNNAFFNSSVAALGGKNVGEAFGAGFLGGAAGAVAGSAMSSETGQSVFGDIKSAFGLNDSQMKYIQGGATAMGTAAISGQDPQVALTNYVAQNIANVGKTEIGKQFTSAKNYFVKSYDEWETAKADQKYIIERRNALYEEAKPVADQYTALKPQYDDVVSKLKADNDYIQKNRGGYDAAMAAYESDKSDENIDRVNAEIEKLKPYTDSFDKNKAAYEKLDAQVKDLNTRLTDYSIRLNGFDSDIQSSNDKITQLSDTFADAATKYEGASKQVGKSLVEMAEADIRIGAEELAIQNERRGRVQVPAPPVEPPVATEEPPSGLHLAAGPSDTVSDAGNGYKVEVGGAPIYAESPNADKVRVPFGYDLMPSQLNETGKRPSGAYYDELLNAWLMPNTAAADLQAQLMGNGSGQTEPPTGAVVNQDDFDFGVNQGAVDKVSDNEFYDSIGIKPDTVKDTAPASNDVVDQLVNSGVQETPPTLEDIATIGGQPVTVSPGEEVIPELEDTTPVYTEPTWTPPTGLPPANTPTGIDNEGADLGGGTEFNRDQFYRDIGIDPASMKDEPPMSQEDIDAIIRGENVPVHTANGTVNISGGKVVIPKPVAPAPAPKPATPAPTPAPAPTPKPTAPTPTQQANQSSMLNLLSLLDQQPQQQQTPVQDPYAKIKSFQGDLFGGDISTDFVSAATGGSVDDLLRLLRS